MKKALFYVIVCVYILAVLFMLVRVVKTAFFPTQGGPPTSMPRSGELMVQTLVLAAISLVGAALFFLLTRLNVI